MNDPLLPAAPQSAAAPVQPRSSAGRKVLITLCVLFGLFGITAASAALFWNHTFHAAPFAPVALTAAEQQALDAKMAVLGGQAQVPQAPASDPAKTIVLNEREINAWLQEQGLGENIQFNIRTGGFGATVIAPVDKDTPVLGEYFAGHTVRIKVSFNTKLDEHHHLALSLADVSVAGISMPNAWLGDVKGLNLLAQNNSAGEESPFQKGFAAGIKDFQMRDGELRVVLND